MDEGSLSYTELERRETGVRVDFQQGRDHQRNRVKSTLRGEKTGVAITLRRMCIRRITPSANAPCDAEDNECSD